MSLFKCKMCGGTIEFEQGATVGVCDSCGTKQTLPRLDDERRANLYDRANHFRRLGEFDKAEGIFESILAEDRTDAEAYWSLILCKYGISYVTDPRTRRQVPTVNRAQFTPVVTDENYLSAIEYADTAQKSIYENEARAIDRIQKGILEISQREEPFDVFICYKETDENDERTQDSVYAQDIYNALTREGYKVFFSRITLENRLGSEYEPYIFAALNSAKVMLVVGTSKENLESVWVKNEWSRYLQLIRKGEEKTLIPVYAKMSPYELPDEFSNLMAQDLGKIGFMQDLLHGIQKLTKKKETAAVRETVVVNTANSNVAPLLRRAFMFLEDGDWDRADEFCEQVLNQDPENAEAYLGKLMAELHVSKQKNLADCDVLFNNNGNFLKAVKFADERFAETLTDYSMEAVYRKAESLLSLSKKNADCEKAAELFKSIEGYKDSSAKAEECISKVTTIRTGKSKKSVKVVLATMLCAAVMVAGIFIYLKVIVPSNKMNKIKNANVGDIVFFGTYEQDNNLENGKEDIEWRILAKEGSKLLLISEKGLDCQPFNISWTSVTWESCSLRKWLNDTFLNTAFSTEEQANILSTTVSAYRNPEYSTDPGSTTTDKVFLLSINEAVKYLSSDERKCAPTAYAIAQGEWSSDSNTTADGTDTFWWWLRSPGCSQAYAASVSHRGSVEYFGNDVFNVSGAVRPTLWIDLCETVETDTFTEKRTDSSETTKLIIKDLKYAEVGDGVLFGAYEQDNNMENGKEDIEWRVLAKENNRLLVISDKELDRRPYNTADTVVTWESCSLRKWMNDTFLNTAFSTEEQTMIQRTTVPADKNPKYDTNPGNATTDKVFLLSINEAEKYFVSDSERQCKPTEYAVANGAAFGANSCWWWLRSPGLDQHCAADVDSGGHVHRSGPTVDRDDGGVRPAMWISLES